MDDPINYSDEDLKRYSAGAEEAAKYAKETASQLYNKRKKEVDKLVSKFQQNLKKHANKQKKNPDNFGFAGDLGKVFSDLVDLNKFIG